jgi:hypothetical protein
MAAWSEDTSLFTASEVVLSQYENRAWRKELQRKVNVLMDTKLAKQISPETYITKNKLLKQDFAECDRRSRILGNEALSRRRRSKPRLVLPIRGGRRVWHQLPMDFS